MKTTQQFFSIYSRATKGQKQPKELNIGNFSRWVDYNPIRRKQEAIPYKIRQQVLRDHNFRCDFCGRQIGMELHHIITRKIGDHAASNFRLLCKRCHREFRHRNLVGWQFSYEKGIGY